MGTSQVNESPAWRIGASPMLGVPMAPTDSLLLDPDFVRDPHAGLERLRAEEPVTSLNRTMEIRIEGLDPGDGTEGTEVAR